MPDVRVALFDLDDTLVDRQLAFLTATEQFVLDHRLPSDAVEVILGFNQRGMVDWPVWMAQTRDRFSLSVPLDDLIERQRQRFLDCFLPDSDILDALAALRGEDWRIGVVTNGGALIQPVKVRNAGLTDALDVLVVSDIEDLHKPDRAIFELALSRLGARGSCLDDW